MRIPAWLRWDTTPPVTDEQILSATGAWMLCCAVGAENRTLSIAGTIDFDTWWLCCRTTWIPRVAKDLDIGEERLRSTIKSYAVANAHKSYMQVFDEEKLLHPDKR